MVHKHVVIVQIASRACIGGIQEGGNFLMLIVALMVQWVFNRLDYTM